MTTTTESTEPGGSVDEVSASDDTALVLVRGLSVRYGSREDGFTAVDNVSFDIAPGERVALVGESGSGKSTLAMTIAGLVGASGSAQVEAERLLFDGKPIGAEYKGSVPLRNVGISMVFQDAMTALDPVWTIGGQFKHVLTASGVRGRRAVREQSAHWLEKVGLTDVKRVLASRPYELSGGMRQRVMTALALCGTPKLLIADEPTSALDASLARGAMELLQELALEQGSALLIVSHDIKLCLEFSDTMLVMYHGELVEHRSTATILDSAEHPYTRGLLSCVPTLANRSAKRLPTLADFVTE